MVGVEQGAEAPLRVSSPQGAKEGRFEPFPQDPLLSVSRRVPGEGALRRGTSASKASDREFKYPLRMHHPLRSSLLFASLGFLLASLPSSAPAEAWSSEATKQGKGFAYEVFSQAADGEEYVRYRAKGTIAATPETLGRSVRVIASDPERAPEGHTRRVLEDDADAFIVHTHIDLPALFSDRDIVTLGENKTDTATGVRRIDWKAIDDRRAPPSEDVVRIRKSAGFWEFKPLADGRSEVIYETYIDLGGSLPGWLVQPMMASMVGTNFEQLAGEALGGAPAVAAPPAKPR